MRRRPLFLLGGLAVASAAFLRRAPAADPPKVPPLSFESEGHVIPGERTLPAASGCHPAIMLLHGADGYQNPFFQEIYRSYGRMLAASWSVCCKPTLIRTR